jgi:zinc/manganese transport system substrate-binding protein
MLPMVTNFKGTIMKKLIYLLSLLYFNPAFAQVNIFSCEPEWTSLLSELGRTDVTVYTATTALQDPHHIQARPSLIAKMRRADLIVCTGAGLEAGWLPVLLRRSANPKVQQSTPGNFMATQYVQLLDKPARLDRAAGDIHAAGNPHIHTNPENIKKVAIALTQRLVTISPADKTNFENNLKVFLQRWNKATKIWNQRAVKLHNLPVVTQHQGWSYLIQWLQLKEIARLEAKPGIPPSTSHLMSVLSKLKNNPARGIIRSAYQSDKASNWLHTRTGLPVVIMPYTVGGTENAKDLFSLFDETLSLLEKINHE